MSQIIKASVSSSPTVPTSFVTDLLGPAVPIANTLQILGDETSDINTNGIVTTGSTNVVTIELTNRFSGTATTTNATPDTSIALSLGATPGVYTFDVQIAGFDVTDSLGLGFAIFGTIRTDGATATICGTPDKVVNKENATLATTDANLTASGNNAVIELTGLVGKTINWRTLATFVFVS